jgi:hypothetical protein
VGQPPDQFFYTKALSSGRVNWTSTTLRSAFCLRHEAPVTKRENIPSANRRRGQLFAVATVAWVFLILVVYPISQERIAQGLYQQDREACYLGAHQETVSECLRVAELESGVNQWRLKAYYTRGSWHLLFLVAGVPILIRLVLHGLAALPFSGSGKASP